MTRDDAPAIATYLADELDLDYFQTLDRLRAGGGSRFEYVARRVPSTVANRVLGDLETRGYKGLSVRRDPMRDYPSRDVAANLIGFLGEDEPLAGLERTFDAQLSGTDGEATYEVGGGNRIPLGNSTTVKPRNGTDLRLTIDRDVQWYVQRVLRSTVRGAGGDSGVAVVMDSRTGELISLADYPSFDAQTPFSAAKDDLGSRAVSDVYEPGSVEKVLTASALIDAGKLSPLTHIQVPSELPRPGAAPLRDHWDHDLLRYTLAGVISRSSNIGTVLAARKFTPEELHGYLTKFGLGQRTDIGVRGETAGLLADPSLWAQGNQDTIAFGQGLSVNAVQMAAAVNTIANRGVRVDPSLVRGHATTDDGTVVGTDTVTRHRVVSARAAKQTMLMMELVTDVDDGVAPGAAIPGYRVAGKTGTAQRAGKNGRYDDTFTVSFAGFAPADQPRFTVYVLVQNPRNGGGGGSVAGPAFSKIMSYLLRRYAVPPTGTKPSTYPVEY
jgi:cell division protein FtsI (penicillin-binding protein 3)